MLTEAYVVGRRMRWWKTVMGMDVTRKESKHCKRMGS